MGVVGGGGAKVRWGFCEIDGACSGEECSSAQQGAIMRAESSRQRSQGGKEIMAQKWGESQRKRKDGYAWSSEMCAREEHRGA